MAENWTPSSRPLARMAPCCSRQRTRPRRPWRCPAAPRRSRGADPAHRTPGAGPPAPPGGRRCPPRWCWRCRPAGGQPCTRRCGRQRRRGPCPQSACRRGRGDGGPCGRCAPRPRSRGSRYGRCGRPAPPHKAAEGRRWSPCWPGCRPPGSGRRPRGPGTAPEAPPPPAGTGGPGRSPPCAPRWSGTARPVPPGAPRCCSRCEN